MRLSSPLPHKKARIEIIPLIDIMFFLLASFMMVSLSQTHMKGIRVNLPSGPPPPTTEPKKDFVSIQVREGSQIYIDGAPIAPDDVHGYLFRIHEQNPEVKVSISAEMMALHGDVIRILDEVRTVKITKVGYQIRAAQALGGPVAPAAPGAPAPPSKKPR